MFLLINPQLDFTKQDESYNLKGTKGDLSIFAYQLMRDNKTRKGCEKMDLTSLLQQIDDLKLKLDRYPKFNEGELARLREHFMVENTYHSNAIEGNTLTLHETRLSALRGLTINQNPLREHLKAMSHRNAFEYIAVLADKKGKFMKIGHKKRQAMSPV